MARSISEIKATITAVFMANATIATIYGFAIGSVFENEFSKVSIENLLFDLMAISINQFEKLFDIHSAQVDKAIYDNKPGTKRWYQKMALKFQFGFGFYLFVDDDEFDNTGFTTAQIEASKIVKYCSVKESIESSRVIIKIAGDDGTNLIPLTGTQITAFKYYMSEVSYAGVKINVVNNPADKLALTMKVYRNPLIIDDTGNNILTGGKTVEAAVKKYIKNLPFDGELVINDMIDFLRDVPGVDNVHIISAQTSYKDLVTSLYKPFVTIDVKTIPVAGYFVAGSIANNVFIANDFMGVTYVV